MGDFSGEEGNISGSSEVNINWLSVSGSLVGKLMSVWDHLDGSESNGEHVLVELEELKSHGQVDVGVNSEPVLLLRVVSGVGGGVLNIGIEGISEVEVLVILDQIVGELVSTSLNGGSADSD